MTQEQERRLWERYTAGCSPAELAREEGLPVADVVRVLDRYRSRPAPDAGQDDVWARWRARQEELAADPPAAQVDRGPGEDPGQVVSGEELDGGGQASEVDQGAQLRASLAPWILGGVLLGTGLAAFGGGKPGRPGGGQPAGTRGAGGSGPTPDDFLRDFWRVG